MPQRYDVIVSSNTPLTPHMRRVVLHGDCLQAFPADQESGYVKIGLVSDVGEPIKRSYTIRAFDSVAAEVTLDFVDHGDAGPASRWSRHARPGDPLSMYGPGEKKLVDPTADWVLLAGDMTSLPAISVNLERLPKDTVGYAVIELSDERDQQPLIAPAGVQVVWVVNSDRGHPNRLLTQTVRDLPWLGGRPYPWFAGEFEGMRDMRGYFRDERGVDRRAMYLSCYWKRGASDDQMKRAKKLDAEQDAALVGVAR